MTLWSLNLFRYLYYMSFLPHFMILGQQEVPYFTYIYIGSDLMNRRTYGFVRLWSVAE